MVPGNKMSAHFVTLFFYVGKKFTDINVGSLHDVRVSFHVLAKVAHSLVVTIIPNATSFTYMCTWWYALVFLVFFHSQFFLSNKSRLRKIISYAKDGFCTHKMITRAKSCRTIYQWKSIKKHTSFCSSSPDPLVMIAKSARSRKIIVNNRIIFMMLMIWDDSYSS